MVKLLWDSSEPRGAGADDFRPEEYQGLLDRLSGLMAAELAFGNEREARTAGGTCVPVRLGNNRTGWAVTCPATGESAARGAQAAAEVVSRLFTAEQDISSLAVEVADRYEELNFLYEMSSSASAP